MKVEFKFGIITEIILLPENPKEVERIRMCFEEGIPQVKRNGNNSIIIDFQENSAKVAPKQLEEPLHTYSNIEQYIRNLNSKDD